MSTRVLALAGMCLALAGCARGGEVPDASQAGVSGRSSAPSTSSPSPWPWTDCNALQAGDALNFQDLQCNQEELQVRMLDCSDGTYVHLARPGRGDLEGIDGVTPAWLEAAPVDPRHGRTLWAVENCKEHG